MDYMYCPTQTIKLEETQELCNDAVTYPAILPYRIDQLQVQSENGFVRGLTFKTGDIYTHLPDDSLFEPAGEWTEMGGDVVGMWAEINTNSRMKGFGLKVNKWCTPLDEHMPDSLTVN